jgi:hypothetical protein
VTSREMTMLLREVQKLGFEVKYRKCGHYKIMTPQGPVFCSSTPSDRRAAIHRIKSELRKHGVELKPAKSAPRGTASAT